MATKLAKPRVFDQEWMVTTCTPLETSVEFFDSEAEALAAARLNVAADTTTYVGRVIKQGSSTGRPTDHQVTVVAKLSPAKLAAARHLVRLAGQKTSRKNVAALITKMLDLAIAKL